MVRGGVMPERRKVAYGMTSMGTGTPEKEKASNFRGGCPPRKPARHLGKGKTNEIPPLSATAQKKNKKYYFSY